MARIKSFREAGERYPVLRLMAAFGHAIGVLMVFLSAFLLVFGLTTLVSNSMPFGGFGVGIVLVWSCSLFLAGLQSFALGSFLRLMIDVEENTRATAQALDRLRAAAEPKPEVDLRTIFLS